MIAPIDGEDRRHPPHLRQPAAVIRTRYQPFANSSSHMVNTACANTANSMSSVLLCSFTSPVWNTFGSNAPGCAPLASTSQRNWMARSRLWFRNA
jgi:hypothetical protein